MASSLSSSVEPGVGGVLALSCAVGLPTCGKVQNTSTNLNYTGLKLGSNSHFYGRAATEKVLAGFLSALLRLAVANGAPGAQRPRRAAAAAAAANAAKGGTWTGVVSLSKVGAAASRASTLDLERSVCGTVWNAGTMVRF